MSLQSPVRVQQPTTTTGTSAYSLSPAASNYRNFRAQYANGHLVPYLATDGTANYEVGVGLLAWGSPDTITRRTILESSNGNAAVNWAAGSKNLIAFELAGSASGYAVPFGSYMTLDLSSWGTSYVFEGNAASVVTLPALNTVPPGYSVSFKNTFAETDFLLTISPSGSDQIEALGAGVAWKCPPGGGASFASDGTVWRQFNIISPKGGIAHLVEFTNSRTIFVSSWGNYFLFNGSSAETLTLPEFVEVPAGWSIQIRNDSTFPLSIAPSGSDEIENFGAGVSWTLPPGATLQLTPGDSVWRQTLITYPPNTPTTRIVTTNGNITVEPTDDIVIVRQETPAAITITLPSSPFVGQTISLIDGAGVAFTYNMTIQGSADINGASTYVLMANWQGVTLIWNGTIWNIFSRGQVGYGM